MGRHSGLRQCRCRRWHGQRLLHRLDERWLPDHSGRDLPLRAVWRGDAFITKLGPTGTPVYSTYLGGDLMDEGLAITVDTTGNAYVAGSTGSSNFPTTANAVQATMPNATVTGFVTEVNSTATQILVLDIPRRQQRRGRLRHSRGWAGQDPCRRQHQFEQLPHNGKRAGTARAAPMAPATLITTAPGTTPKMCSIRRSTR